MYVPGGGVPMCLCSGYPAQVQASGFQPVVPGFPAVGNQVSTLDKANPVLLGWNLENCLLRGLGGPAGVPTARVFLICGVGRGEGKKHQEAEIISLEGVTGFSLEMKPWGRDQLHLKPRAICATPPTPTSRARSSLGSTSHKPSQALSFPAEGADQDLVPGLKSTFSV